MPARHRSITSTTTSTVISHDGAVADLDQVYLELHPAKVIVEANELEGVPDEAEASGRLSSPLRRESG
jgi:hypothetical protein